MLPHGSTITSSHTAMLAMNHLPEEARRYYLLTELKYSLLSISQLCDSRYMSLFDDTGVYIIKDARVTMYGQRNEDTRLYIINLSDQVSPTDLTLTHNNKINTANF